MASLASLKLLRWYQKQKKKRSQEVWKPPGFNPNRCSVTTQASHIVKATELESPMLLKSLGSQKPQELQKSLRQKLSTVTVDVTKLGAEVAPEFLLGTGDLVGVVWLKMGTKILDYLETAFSQKIHFCHILIYLMEL